MTWVGRCLITNAVDGRGDKPVFFSCSPSSPEAVDVAGGGPGLVPGSHFSPFRPKAVRLIGPTSHGVGLFFAQGEVLA